jgi:hypothetical protein
VDYVKLFEEDEGVEYLQGEGSDVANLYWSEGVELE